MPMLTQSVNRIEQLLAERKELKKMAFLLVKRVMDQTSRLRHEEDVTFHSGRAYAKYLQRSPEGRREELLNVDEDTLEEMRILDQKAADEKGKQRELFIRIERIEAELHELGHRFQFWEK